MKQQTVQPKNTNKFIYDSSRWINIYGKEVGESPKDKNHFVSEQGEKVCEMLEDAFKNSTTPDLFIISPFKSVVDGMKDYIRDYCNKNKETKIIANYFCDITSNRIGTVHTFQGKEADEVVFLLGCDETSKGAVRWVNTNIVNVAVTRAKYRLYVIGSESVWKESKCVSKAKEIMDTFAIKEIQRIRNEEVNETNREALLQASENLPSATSFASPYTGGNGDEDYSLKTEHLLQCLSDNYMNANLSATQLNRFGFSSQKDLDKLSKDARENVEVGIKLYDLLEPVFEINKNIDSSCCAILFCKAFEIMMKDCFYDNLVSICPMQEVRINGRTINLKKAKKDNMTLGTFQFILKNNIDRLGKQMCDKGHSDYDSTWWKDFVSKLNDCVKKRNLCCHSQRFQWDELQILLKDLFGEINKETSSTSLQKGLMVDCLVGKKLGK